MKNLSLKAPISVIDRFFMTPGDLRILLILRPAFAILLFINVLVLWQDRHMFYGPESTVSFELYQSMTANGFWSMFQVFPYSSTTVDIYFTLMLASIVWLGSGYWCRPAALVTFVLLTGLQNGNSMIFDGEDTMFRLFTFFMIFVPGADVLKKTRESAEANPNSAWPVWPLRMFQLQMCLMFFCCALQKLRGEQWADGTALYYVFRLYDFYKLQLPDFMVESTTWIAVMSWGVIVFELVAPILIWFKETRIPTILSLIVFHLFLEATMSLFLFHWIMILGWLTFVGVDDLKALCPAFLRKAPAPEAESLPSTQMARSTV